VGQAVLHSARFPIVTPAGAFAPPWGERNKAARLVDGGYADNSGTTTLFDVFSPSPAPHAVNAQPRLVNIDGNPNPDSPCEKDAGNPPILTGVRGLLQARTAHASRAVDRLERRTDTQLIPVQLDLAEALAREPRSRGGKEVDVCKRVARAQQAPLGWYMSYEAAAVVAKSAELGVERICKTLAFQCQPAVVKMPRAD
jgi:hypothetical protein